VVRILLILSVILGLDTKLVDYTCAFLHALIAEDVYVHMPRGFEEEAKVLKLKDHYMDCGNLQETSLNT